MSEFALERVVREGSILMGDMGEIFNAMKEHRKMKRRENTVKAEEEHLEFAEAAKEGGYNLDQKSQHHWNVYRDGKCVAQYWPSANKWQTIKDGRIHHGDRESFRMRLRARRF